MWRLGPSLVTAKDLESSASWARVPSCECRSDERILPTLYLADMMVKANKYIVNTERGTSNH
jgi:hypothetical protein